MSVPVNRSGMRSLGSNVRELFAGQESIRDYIAAFEVEWTGMLAPSNWRESLNRWHEIGVPVEDIREAARITRGRANLDDDARFRYFCGVVWRKVRASGTGGY